VVWNIATSLNLLRYHDGIRSRSPIKLIKGSYWSHFGSPLVQSHVTGLRLFSLTTSRIALIIVIAYKYMSLRAQIYTRLPRDSRRNDSVYYKKLAQKIRHYKSLSPSASGAPSRRFTIYSKRGTVFPAAKLQQARGILYLVDL